MLSIAIGEKAMETDTNNRPIKHGYMMIAGFPLSCIFPFYFLFICNLAGNCATKEAIIKKSSVAQQSPRMEPRRGNYFSWKAPIGWKISETISGIDLSSPDRKAAVYMPC